MLLTFSSTFFYCELQFLLILFRSVEKIIYCSLTQYPDVTKVKAILKIVEKKMIWFWEEFDPQTQVIRSFIIQATFATSHASSPKRKHNIKMKTQKIMKEI